MKAFVTTLLIAGAAVGVYYLLKDNENVKQVLNKAKDGASDALNKVNWKKAGKRAINTLADQA